jgi:hypothetical protein
LGEFLTLYLHYGVWAALLAISGAVSYYLFHGLNKDDGRGRWVAWLRHDTFARRYKALLTAALDRLDRYLAPDFPPDPTDLARPKTEPARAWSVQLLDICLLLAVAYPVLSVLAHWIVTGDARRLGEVEVVPAQDETWRRLVMPSAIVGPLLLLAMLLIETKRHPNRLPNVVAFAIAMLAQA